MHVPVNSITVFAFGSMPLCTTRSTTPVGGVMPLSLNVSFRPVFGSDARYFVTSGLRLTVSTFPTMTNVKSLASAKRSL